LFGSNGASSLVMLVTVRGDGQEKNREIKLSYEALEDINKRG
jgi:hypothetical protein